MLDETKLFVIAISFKRRLFMAKFYFLWALLLSMGFAVGAEAQQRAATFNLSWQDNSDNESGFIIYRGGVEAARTGANVVTFSDQVTGNEGQQICYEVSAVNSAGESGRAGPACGTIPTINAVAPTNLTVSVTVTVKVGP